MLEAPQEIKIAVLILSHMQSLFNIQKIHTHTFYSWSLKTHSLTQRIVTSMLSFKMTKDTSTGMTFDKS